MKKEILHAILILLSMITLSRCKKTETEITDYDTHIIFWTSEPISGKINVSCNGKAKEISTFYLNGSPSCGDLSNATFDLIAGTYPFTATDGFQTWSGSISVGINECKKIDVAKLTPIPISNADIMKGTYTGNGKHLPGNINLGNSTSCSGTIFSYQPYLENGVATLNINRITDDTVSLQFSSNAFNTIVYSTVAISKNGSILSFNSVCNFGVLSGTTFYSGTYNLTTKYFAFSGVTFQPGFSYGANDCFIGFPYVLGSALVTPYYYFTIDHLEFTGVKN